MVDVEKAPWYTWPPDTPRNPLGHLREISKATLRAFRRRDDASRAKFIASLQRWLLPEWRLSDPAIAWHSNPFFHAYLDQFGELRRFNAPRRWNLYQLALQAIEIPGDTAECGSFEGASSWLICHIFRETGKTHYIFDSFEGLSEPGEKDGGHWSQGMLAHSEEDVRKRLAEFPDLETLAGWIPDRFAEVANREFAFVDVDLEVPTRDSFEFFYPRLSPGGILVCDDYGFTTCPGATETIDDYLADKPEKMVGLSAGGGFMMKRAD